MKASFLYHIASTAHILYLGHSKALQGWLGMKSHANRSSLLKSLIFCRIFQRICEINVLFWTQCHLVRLCYVNLQLIMIHNRHCQSPSHKGLNVSWVYLVIHEQTACVYKSGYQPGSKFYYAPYKLNITSAFKNITYSIVLLSPYLRNLDHRPTSAW